MASATVLEISGSNQKSVTALNQRGSALPFLLAFLPVILTSFVLLAVSSAWITQSMATKHLCRTGLLRTQKQIDPILTQLMGLNPLALALRADRQRTLAQIARAPHPAAVAVLFVKLGRIHQKQYRLDLRQKSLIRLGQQKLRLGVQATVGDLHRHFISEKNLWGTQAYFVFLPRKRIIPPLAVRPDTPTGLAPKYELLPQFEKQQTALISWSLRMSPGSIWKKWFSGNKILQSDQCAATLTKENSGWKEILNEVKF